MKQAKYNLTLWTGRKFAMQFGLRSVTGDPVNLANHTAAAEIKTQPGGDSVANMTANITDASLGLITLSLGGNVTASIDPGRYVWDLMLTNGSGDDLPPYVGGGVTVLESVTD